jgi:hypothetical protein
VNPCRKVVLKVETGYRPELFSLVQSLMAQGVNYIGVVGPHADEVEDAIDAICVGDGSDPYEMLTASHQGESLQAAIDLAEQLSGEFSGEVRVVAF